VPPIGSRHKSIDRHRIRGITIGLCNLMLHRMLFAVLHNFLNTPLCFWWVVLDRSSMSCDNRVTRDAPRFSWISRTRSQSAASRTVLCPRARPATSVDRRRAAARRPCLSPMPTHRAHSYSAFLVRAAHASTPRTSLSLTASPAAFTTAVDTCFCGNARASSRPQTPPRLSSLRCRRARRHVGPRGAACPPALAGHSFGEYAAPSAMAALQLPLPAVRACRAVVLRPLDGRPPLRPARPHVHPGDDALLQPDYLVRQLPAPRMPTQRPQPAGPRRSTRLAALRAAGDPVDFAAFPQRRQPPPRGNTDLPRYPFFPQPHAYPARAPPTAVASPARRTSTAADPRAHPRKPRRPQATPICPRLRLHQPRTPHPPAPPHSASRGRRDWRRARAAAPRLHTPRRPPCQATRGRCSTPSSSQARAGSQPQRVA